MAPSLMTESRHSSAGRLLEQRKRDGIRWRPLDAAAWVEARAKNQLLAVLVTETHEEPLRARLQALFGSIDVARALDENFLPCVVDADEAPELAELTLLAARLLGAHPTLPALLFLLPQGVPTFVWSPSTDRIQHDRQSLIELARQLHHLETDSPDELLRPSLELERRIRERLQHVAPGFLSIDLVRRGALALVRAYDWSAGWGFGPGPFPCAEAELLLRFATRTGDKRALETFEALLERLLSSSAFDQLRGGFFDRSSPTDTSNFEKPLGLNLRLCRLYLDAFHHTGRSAYRRVARETLDFLREELQSPRGPLWTSLGKGTTWAEGQSFYSWSYAELERNLGPRARPFARFFSVPEDGSRVELRATERLQDVMKAEGLSQLELTEALEYGRMTLLAERARRSSSPAPTDSILTGEVGETIHTFALAARHLGDPELLEVALRNLHFALDHLFVEPTNANSEGAPQENSLARGFRDGEAFGEARLGDWSSLLLGATELFAVSHDSVAERFAERLAPLLLSRFASPSGALMSTPQPLLETFPRSCLEPLGSARSSPVADIPQALLGLTRLAELTSDTAGLTRATTTALAYGGTVRTRPAAYPNFLGALDALFQATWTLDERTSPAATPKTELGRRRLVGAATKEGTVRFFAGRSMKTGLLGELTVSRFGIGLYRSSVEVPSHHETLALAFDQGLNLLDTSPAYANHESERLVGESLAAAIEKGAITREQVVLITKVGVVSEPERELALRSGLPAFENDASASGPLLCHDPNFITLQLEGSLERLGLETVDCCLVEAPEQAGPRLVSCFERLERLREEGKIRRYGVSSRAELLGPNGPLPLSRLVEQAGPGFQWLEVPLNLLEREALEDSCFFEETRALGLSVITTRPLQAFTATGLLRLVDEPMDPNASANDLPRARYQLQALEAEFETTLAPGLRVRGLLGNAPPLDLGGPIGQALERAPSLAQFDAGEATLVTPRLAQTLRHLDRAHQGPIEVNWQKFRARYIGAVGRYLACTRAQARARQEKLLAPVLNELRLQNGTLRPLEEEALRYTLDLPNVSSTLIGLRQPDHVQKVRALLESTR